jgi:hypothetical protein
VCTREKLTSSKNSCSSRGHLPPAASARTLTSLSVCRSFVCVLCVVDGGGEKQNKKSVRGKTVKKGSSSVFRTHE